MLKRLSVSVVPSGARNSTNTVRVVFEVEQKMPPGCAVEPRHLSALKKAAS